MSAVDSRESGQEEGSGNYMPPSPQPDSPQSDTPHIDLTTKTTHSDGIKDNDQDAQCPVLTPDTTPTKDLTKVTKKTETKSDTDICVDSLKDLNAKLRDSHSEVESELRSAESCRDCNPVASPTDSPRPSQAKLTRAETGEAVPSGRGQGGRGRGRPSKGRGRAGASRPVSSTNPDNAATAEITATKTKAAPKAKSTKSRKADQSINNHKVTEYFPVRRSSRRPLSDIKKEKHKDLVDSILSGSEDGLKVVMIEGKGRGVVSSKIFKKGDFVVEYTGYLCDTATAKDREKKYVDNPEFGCYMYHFTHNNKGYCVDATAESGKLGRLLNHSRLNGNCCTKVVPINGRPYLILVAARDIAVGEELLYDYGDRSKESLEAHPWLAF